MFIVIDLHSENVHRFSLCAGSASRFTKPLQTPSPSRLRTSGALLTSTGPSKSLFNRLRSQTSSCAGEAQSVSPLAGMCAPSSPNLFSATGPPCGSRDGISVTLMGFYSRMVVAFHLLPFAVVTCALCRRSSDVLPGCVCLLQRLRTCLLLSIYSIAHHAELQVAWPSALSGSLSRAVAAWRCQLKLCSAPRCDSVQKAST